MRVWYSNMMIRGDGKGLRGDGLVDVAKTLSIGTAICELETRKGEGGDEVSDSQAKVEEEDGETVEDGVGYLPTLAFSSVRQRLTT